MKAQHSDLELVDAEFLGSLEAAVGPDAMKGMVAALLRDCDLASGRLEALFAAGAGQQLARESHRLSGALAQFGCLAAAHGFRQASHAATAEECARLARNALDLIGPTREKLQSLYAIQQKN